jgi:hypothetical protein
MHHASGRDPSIARVTKTTVTLCLALSLLAGRARADTTEASVPTPAPPTPTKMVGGHIGVALPLVTVSKETKSIGDQFTILNPIGIGFKVSPHVAIDFETVVGTPIHPTGTTSLVVDPGVIFGFGKLALGVRLAFQVNALANVGLIPLVNYGLVDFDGGTWFVEAAFPTFYQDHEIAFNVVAHTGVAF